MSSGSEIFKFLKRHGAADLDEIIKETGVEPNEAATIIERYMKNRWIDHLPNGKYRIKFVLDPPLVDEPIATKYYNYTIIREKLQGGGAIPAIPADVPRKWRNPYLAYLPTQVDQGERGTCCGYSTAIGLTLLYFAITQDFPTPEELKAITRNIEEQLGCTNAKPLVRDNFGKRWKSAQFVYDRSREVGGVTEPSGSYLSAIVKAIRDFGACFETECWTSKSPYCVSQFYPIIPGESGEESKVRIMALAAEHKTKGYATVIDFEQFCVAIYTQWRDHTGGGFGLVPINIYENYTSNGCEGNYPDPAGEVIGSHAQCAVGYDLDAGTLEFRQSWGKNWTDDGGISKRYWDEAAGAAFVILDDEETKVGQALYSRVEISANVPCNFTIDGELHTANPLVVALERGKSYEIIAFPTNPELVTVPSLEHELTPTEENQSVSFVFALKPAPVIKKTWIEIFIELIRVILARLGIK
jgi:hypothetical protein